MNTQSLTSSSLEPRVLSILRVVAGIMFVAHGTGKLFHLPLLPGLESVTFGSLLGAAATIEIIGGILITLGLFTRPTAFILSGEMAFAYFIGHAPGGPIPLLNGGEPAVLYCFLFLYFAARGAGSWSLDACRFNGRKSGSN
jgi:putative oxidoreductase